MNNLSSVDSVVKIHISCSESLIIPEVVHYRCLERLRDHGVVVSVRKWFHGPNCTYTGQTTVASKGVCDCEPFCTQNYVRLLPLVDLFQLKLHKF